MNRATRNAGFSLVEIMVGMVIGLIGIIIIMQIFAVAEGQKRTTTSGADAQTNGNIALFTIERDARQAGYGMTLNGLGCKINHTYGVTVSLVLAPVLINEGGVDGLGNAFPDFLTLFYSTNTITGMPELLQSDVGNVAKIASNLSVAQNDMVVFYEAGKDCALAQVTSPPANNTDFNHTTGAAGFPYAANDTVFNFGSMVHRIYSIDTVNNNLQVCEVSANSVCPAVAIPVPLAGEIVNLQAQYGKDTDGDGVVDTWFNGDTGAVNLIPPSGVGTSAQWAQTLAVRIAILARSGQQEKPDPVTGLCTATTAAPIAFSGLPQGSIPMAVPVPVPLPPGTGPTGLPSCYRYKVFETVVPLRNIIWG